MEHITWQEFIVHLRSILHHQRCSANNHHCKELEIICTPNCMHTCYNRQNFSYRSHVPYRPPHHVAEEESWSVVEAFWRWSTVCNTSLRFLEPGEALRGTWYGKVLPFAAPLPRLELAMRSRGLRSGP